MLSHACGVGPLLTREQTRAILCGHRQLQPRQIRRFGGAGAASLALLNQQITPQVPSQGSVGYLTHMAHIGLALIGVGDVEYQQQVMPAEQALRLAGLQPYRPGAKEGLSSVNGTPCMTGLSCLALDDGAAAGLCGCHRRDELRSAARSAGGV